MKKSVESAANACFRLKAGVAACKPTRNFGCVETTSRFWLTIY
jgi:hypothetical protein